MKNKPYWHIHHRVLLEWNTEPIKNRIKYIKEYKPKDEIPIRLKLLKPVKGKLPLELIEAREKLDESWEKWGEAREKYDEVGKKLDEAREKWIEAREKYDEAREKYDEAREKWIEAGEKRNEAEEKRNEAEEKRKKEIEALHAKECPNCPWNGSTIFPEEEV